MRAMKMTLKLFVASAAAALSIVACQKTDIVPGSTITSLKFTSKKPILEDESKTAWTGTTINWSKGDAIRVAYTCNGVWQNADGTSTADEKSGSKTAKAYQSTSLSADAETAEFSVPGDFKGTAEGTYVFYGAYPSSACTDGTDFKYAPSLTVTIPTAQTPAANSFDSAADIMIGQSVNDYTGIPTEAVPMNWDRMVAHAQLTFKTLKGFTVGEKISKVELSADSEADMVGTHYFYLDTRNISKPSRTVANALTINGTNLYVDETGTFVAWASYLPCTVKSLTVVVTTDKATYTREISSCELVFKKNARNTLTIKMDGAVRNEIVSRPDYSGEWLIAGKHNEVYYAAQKWVSSNNNLKCLSIGYDGSSVTRAEGIEDCKMVFTKIETGTYAGMYTIEDASSTEITKSYLYAAASGSNYLMSHTSLDAHSYWSITENEDGSYKIIAEKSSNRNLMRFNPNEKSGVAAPLVSCYASNSTTGSAITLIPYSAIAEDTRTPLSTPVVIASLNSETPNAIDVMWDAVTNAGSYMVTATPTTGTAVSNTVTADESTTYSYTITSLAYETDYTISVVAKPSDTSLYIDSEAGVAKGIITTDPQPSAGGGELKTWTYEVTATTDPKLNENTPATVNSATWSISMGKKVGNPTTNGDPTKSYKSCGWKWGNNKSNYWSSYTLSTDYFASKSVKSVTVKFLNNGSKSATMIVKQGETTIGTATQTFGTTWTDLKAETTQGTGGTLTINYSVAQASYIHSITVEYYE